MTSPAGDMDSGYRARRLFQHATAVGAHVTDGLGRNDPACTSRGLWGQQESCRHCCGQQHREPRTAGAGGTTRFLARNVLYRIDRDISLFIDEMNGDVVLKDPTMPFVPANKGDYSIKIHHAVVDKDPLSLQALMNNYVFNDADSPLRNIKIAFTDDNMVDMSGQMEKLGIWVGFEMIGSLSPTPDGSICMTPTIVRANGIRVDGLLNFMGIETEADEDERIQGRADAW